jgi:uncharacterized protein (TIRG00374 family)
MTRFLLKIALPWLVTVGALYLAFRGVEWELLVGHLKGVKVGALIGAFVLTVLSYVLRSARWPRLFPDPKISILSSWRVLILGFFMNNILPARAGELVRAHIGGKVSGESRTLVLATIASERLADGLTISVMFAGIILLFGTGHLDPHYARNLLYVAYLFGLIALAVVAVLWMRTPLFNVADALTRRLDTKASTYALGKMRTFVEGLSPLCSPRRALLISLWSSVIWTVELGVFYSVSRAFGTSLPLSATVLFLVAVNFSSLVPAAPGGFGVIELVAKNVLLSVGVASGELALSMVLTQHVIQYAVVGIPGAFMLATLRSQVRDMTIRESEGFSVANGRAVEAQAH